MIRTRASPERPRTPTTTIGSAVVRSASTMACAGCGSRLLAQGGVIESSVQRFVRRGASGDSATSALMHDAATWVGTDGPRPAARRRHGEVGDRSRAPG